MFQKEVLNKKMNTITTVILLFNISILISFE